MQTIYFIDFWEIFVFNFTFLLFLVWCWAPYTISRLMLKLVSTEIVAIHVISIAQGLSWNILKRVGYSIAGGDSI